MHTYQFYTAIHKQSNAVVIGSYNVDLEHRSIRMRASRKIHNIICSALDANTLPCPMRVKHFVEKHAITHHMEDWVVKYGPEYQMCREEARKHVNTLMEFYRDLGFILNPSFYCTQT